VAACQGPGAARGEACSVRNVGRAGRCAAAIAGRRSSHVDARKAKVPNEGRQWRQRIGDERAHGGGHFDVVSCKVRDGDESEQLRQRRGMRLLS
jgi:hypothetical protein